MKFSSPSYIDSRTSASSCSNKSDTFTTHGLTADSRTKPNSQLVTPRQTSPVDDVVLLLVSRTLSGGSYFRPHKCLNVLGKWFMSINVKDRQLVFILSHKPLHVSLNAFLMGASILHNVDDDIYRTLSRVTRIAKT